MSLHINESLVQWILLKNPAYLSTILGCPLGRCLGTEVTTKFGRLDFIFEFGENGLILIELETNIDTAAKFEHATEQLKRYLNLCSNFPTKEVKVALVYASEKSSDPYNMQLAEFAYKSGIILKKFSLINLLQIYEKMFNRLCRTSGISLGRAVALGITSISWLNKFIITFINGFDHFDTKKRDSIPWNELKKKFSSNTNFYVLKRLAEDFELIIVKNSRNGKEVILTDNGIRFRNELKLNLLLNKHDSEIYDIKTLPVSQKRLLVEILLNGNFTKIKVNIFHFLRFIHITEGSWLPKPNTKLTKAEQQYLNNTLRSSYNSRTLKDIIQQTCTFCEELGFLEKIPMDNQLYDKAVFTTLGSRVYGYFEQLLNIERERYQIPLQVQ